MAMNTQLKKKKNTIMEIKKEKLKLKKSTLKKNITIIITKQKKLLLHQRSNLT